MLCHLCVCVCVCVFVCVCVWWIHRGSLALRRCRAVHSIHCPSCSSCFAALSDPADEDMVMVKKPRTAVPTRKPTSRVGRHAAQATSCSFFRFIFTVRVVPQAPIVTLSGHTQPITTVIWPREEELLSAGYDRCIRVWDVATRVNKAVLVRQRGRGTQFGGNVF